MLLNAIFVLVLLHRLIIFSIVGRPENETVPLQFIR